MQSWFTKITQLCQSKKRKKRTIKSVNAFWRITVKYVYLKNTKENTVSHEMSRKYSYLCGEERLKHVLVTSVTLGLQQSPRS